MRFGLEGLGVVLVGGTIFGGMKGEKRRVGFENGSRFRMRV